MGLDCYDGERTNGRTDGRIKIPCSVSRPDFWGSSCGVTERVVPAKDSACLLVSLVASSLEARRA